MQDAQGSRVMRLIYQIGKGEMAVWGECFYSGNCIAIRRAYARWHGWAYAAGPGSSKMLRGFRL